MSTFCEVQACSLHPHFALQDLESIHASHEVNINQNSALYVQ